MILVCQRMRPLKMYLTLLGSMAVAIAAGQGTVNNLVHQSGYVTSTWGQLGDVQVSGTGKQSAILIPGWGFDGDIFKAFAKRHESEFTFYTVTIPGFGSTDAPPMPEQNESFKDLQWTKGVLKGLVDLIDRNQLKLPLIISCFTYSELLAVRLALDHPDKVGRVIIVSGMAKFTGLYPSFEPRTLTQRTNYIDNVLGKQWFKTVTRETWDKGNFVPATFSKDSIKAAAHWRKMSSVPIPVMVRYLCEYYCTDISLEYANLKVPTLVVLPAFTPKALADNAYFAPGFHFSWAGALQASAMIQMVALTETHAFIIDDQPEKLDKLIADFLGGKLPAFNPVR